MRILAYVILAATHALADDPRPPLRFERVVIDADFPGGYQVEVADVNGDKKPDIVALGGSTLAWYENPSWKKRVVSTSKQTPDIISSASADLDGDGKAEIAIAYDFSMNEPKRGKLLLAIQGATPDEPWAFKPIVDENRRERSVPLGGFAEGPVDPPPPISVPSIHRLRWGSISPSLAIESGKNTLVTKPQLIAAALFGYAATPPTFDQSPAALIVFDTGAEPKSGRWRPQLVGTAPVLHAIEVVNFPLSALSVVLAASNRGITSFEFKLENALGDQFQSLDNVPGAPGETPKKGSSEVHLGRLKDGHRFLATVEPWHGTDVAIYLSEPMNSPKLFGPRAVIDSTLKEGHALWVADVDGDGDDEVFAGYRGGTGGVNLYDFDGRNWNRSVLDPGVTAQDLRGGDLDGDGTPDVVAIGGKSRNVVWYRPIRP